LHADLKLPVYEASVCGLKLLVYEASVCGLKLLEYEFKWRIWFRPVAGHESPDSSAQTR
jgi:hypothetical protein